MNNNALTNLAASFLSEIFSQRFGRVRDPRGLHNSPPMVRSRGHRLLAYSRMEIIEDERAGGAMTRARSRMTTHLQIRLAYTKLVKDETRSNTCPVMQRPDFPRTSFEVSRSALIGAHLGKSIPDVPMCSQILRVPPRAASKVENSSHPSGSNRSRDETDCTLRLRIVAMRIKRHVVLAAPLLEPFRHPLCASVVIRLSSHNRPRPI